MTLTLTRAQIEAARERASKATPGPWLQMAGKYVSFDTGETPQVFRAASSEDEVFILAARTDVPALADEILALYALLEDVALDVGLGAFAGGKPEVSPETAQKIRAKLAAFNEGVGDAD